MKILSGRGKYFVIAAALVAAAILVSQLVSFGPRKGAEGVDQQRLLNAAAEPANWLAHGGTFLEQRYSALDQINAGNAAKLGLAWSFEFDTNRGQEATPIVVDGVIYTSTAWSKVYALDGKTGKELWQFDPKVDGDRAVYGCCDVVSRGVAVWKGKVFVATFDGRLIAVDAKTGKQIWSAQTTDNSKPYTITGAPRVFKDKVIIGNGGAELGVRGYVTAYDTETGKLVWRFYTVPGDPAKGPDGAASDPIMATAVKSWAGKWYDYGGGGTVWDSIVYDPDFDQVYLGVGNGSPWNRRIRSDGKGDNLFLASIVALDADTGKYKWHYQGSPGDSWDYTHTQQMMLATLPVDGKERKVLMQAPKNGFFYLIDRETGKLVSAKPFVKQSWVDHIDLKTGRPVMSANAYYEDGVKMIEPSSVGGHNWQPMSYSPRTGLVYIPTVQWSLKYDQDPAYKFRPGRLNIGAQVMLNEKEPNGSGALIAWDPVKQREVWRVEQPEMINGGTLATAGDLVFAGNAHGEFTAFGAKDGKKLWTYKQPVGIMAGPVSYSIDGEQYVAVLVGKGGGAMGIPDTKRPRLPQPNGRIMVFKLGGNAAWPKQDLTPAPANPPKERFAADKVNAGAIVYGENCAACHEGLAAPDLRRSGALADAAVWKSIVIDGALKDNGMVSFARWITPEQAETIRAYMGEQARLLQQEEAKK
ncbi:PQQ-dependent dehydrogenase, methanol/ethanol family [Sphingopyxis macrogoltabida]|uniref:Alcohol dehydrogenase n=1 Tax=Sphingopyxis macrogoltabida TaxID=33050 RepID=A0AAC9FG27_SPHMC|nr:PQQ-dependent dehydrogenase, methanol/ethanol family [Sphingopyxis macrogoltabida]ALJ14772.1 alcohol dehydrogenase [Sphingopyxis macrogoltabida]AMU91028.1 alcohol dehydrogenase [Sphingopyxis macrogoltabida]